MIDRYQRCGCYCTTSMDKLPEGEEYVHVTSRLCWSCQKQEQQEASDHDAYYNDD